MGFRVPVAVITVFFGLAMASGQTQSAASDMGGKEQPGTYRLSRNVRTVVLDVAVVDAQGHPVAGLKAEDFQVQEDGVAQRISFFQGPQEHALPASASGLTGQDLLRKSGDAPLTMLLVDEISTEPEDLAFARKEIADYLIKQPATLTTPTTLLALTGKNLKRLGDFTTNRDSLLKAIRADNDPPSWYVLRNRVPGFKATNIETAPERLSTYLGTLKELAAQMEPYRTRKNLLWVGPGLPALNQTVALNGMQQQAVSHSIGSVVSDLVRARMTLYTIDPQGLIVNPTQLSGLDASGTHLTSIGGDPAEGELAFEQLAPETGGKIFRMRNDVAVGIADSVRDGSAYYTVSYDPKDKSFDGRFRRLRVTLRDPSLRARTREGYVAASASPTQADVAAQALAFALTSGLEYGGVKTSARIVGEGEESSIHIDVSAAYLQWAPDEREGTSIATVTVVVANIKKDGTPEDYKMATMHARASTEATKGATADFLMQYKVSKKAALLRVVVRDQASGRIGSYDVPLRQGA